MANFQKHGQNVHGQTLRAPGATSYEIGLWGPVDTRTMTELTVDVSPPRPSILIKSGSMLSSQNVRVWKLTNLPQGPTTVVAMDSGGAVWTQVTIDTSPTGGGKAPDTPGKIYTDNPNEVATRRTKPTPQEVVSMLLEAWSDLTENGARTLTAQFMAETGDGNYCFNWNLGNVKARAEEPHMYLKNVWECASPSGADGAVARGGGLARLASADEIARHGWKCPNVVVVFDPPHAQCRFRAYASLKEGAQRWLGHHKKIAAGNSSFLASLNAGDCGAVAHALKMARYYTAAESDYARAMRGKKAKIDQALGPVQ